MDFSVTNTDDSGAGSLRWAIEQANDAATPSTITFAVQGTIDLQSDLPPITSTVAIDATTTPGGAPVVGINAEGHAGLIFAAGAENSQLLGLSIGNATGNGVTLEAGNITIARNYIGVATDGSALGNTGNGIYVAASSAGNHIGANPNADSGVISNVISANGGNGIELNGSSQNTLVNNYVGTNATGTIAMANGGNGIYVTGGSDGNTIGGNADTDPATGVQNDPTGNKGSETPTFVTPPLGNLVSGNSQNGILIDDDSQNNVLSGNFVGTSADGESKIGNTLDGIAINGADNNFIIGSQLVNISNPFAYYNVVSGNGGNGLHITDSDNITIQANFFGVDAQNSKALGNTLNGILVDGDSTNVQIGGVIPLGNLASGNGVNGIEIAGAASFVTSFNSFAGVLAFGGTAANGNDGMLITSTGGNQTLQTNVFSGNNNNGLEIGGDASGVTVDPAIIGMSTDGQTVMANKGDGLLIDGTAHDNTIGGWQLSVMPRNIFSGNDGYGLAIEGSAYDNDVFNTYIGTNVGGISAAGNGLGGVLIAGNASNNTIGGALSTGLYPTADLISGNDGNGITLTDGTSGTSILNNIIGYGSDGTPILNSGVPIDAGNSTGNTIEGNQAICYLAGTLIRTAVGNRRVEDLAIGDEVPTYFGGMQRIKWIGRQSFDARFIRNNREKIPVRITAGALGNGLPLRELCVSPGHSMLLRETLALARDLVNGVTITQGTVQSRIDYYQLEFATHDCVLAEGAWSETYADAPGLRAAFHNAASFAAVYPDHMPVPALKLCAPRPESGPALEAALMPVIRHAQAQSGIGPMRGWVEEITPEGFVKGWALDAAAPELPVWLEVLHGGEIVHTMLARAARPDLTAAGHGACAFAVTLPGNHIWDVAQIEIRRIADGLRLPYLQAGKARPAA